MDATGYEAEKGLGALSDTLSASTLWDVSRFNHSPESRRLFGASEGGPALFLFL